MKAKTRRVAALPPAFWDSSAVIPLCCHQPQSSAARRSARLHPRQIVWWATPVEVVGALRRLKREGVLTADEMAQSLARLDYLRRRWSEIQPTSDVRYQAERLLGAHSLRTADALQLAAALAWCRNQPRERRLISGDNALLRAAESEGFGVLRLAL